MAEPNKRRPTPQYGRKGTFPCFKKTFKALAARRADRRVMLLANTSSIRCVAILALGPSGGQRKPVISVNRPYATMFNPPSIYKVEPDTRRAYGVARNAQV
ncbi:hypothetical protein OKW35_009588 [Paraburkholderia sp. MM5477-R1]